MAADLGAGACPPPALAAELQRLGSPRLALGGQSQDFTSPVPASGAPSNWETLTTYSLPAPFWSQLHCLLGATNEPLTVGLNARIGQLGWAEAMVAGAQQAATAGAAVLDRQRARPLLPARTTSRSPSPSRAKKRKEVALYLQAAGYLRAALGSEAADRPRTRQPRPLAGRAPGRARDARTRRPSACTATRSRSAAPNAKRPSTACSRAASATPRGGSPGSSPTRARRARRP